MSEDSSAREVIPSMMAHQGRRTDQRPRPHAGQRRVGVTAQVASRVHGPHPARPARPPRPPRRRAAAAGGRRGRRARGGGRPSWPGCGPRATPRLRALTEQFDGVDLDALRVPPEEIDGGPGSDRRRRCARRSRWPGPRIAAYHAHEGGDPAGLRRRRGPGPAPGAAGRAGRLLRPRRPGPVPLDRAHVCGPGPGGRRGRGGAVRAARPPTAGWTTPPWPPRPSPGSTRSTGSAGPRPSPPWPTAPSRSDGSTWWWARATATWPRPSARCRARSGVASAFAGPSEVVVVAGPETPAALAAVDLVVQAEHGPDGLAWLVTWSEEKADEVAAEVGPAGGRLAPAGRSRGHPGLRRLRLPGGRPRGGDGRGQRGGPRAPRAPASTGPRRCCPWCGRPARCSSARGRRPAWATTWPAPTTCCRPTARPGSPRPCGPTTSAATSTP